MIENKHRYIFRKKAPLGTWSCCSINGRSKQILSLLKPNIRFTEEKTFALPVQDLEGKMALSTKYALYQFLIYLLKLDKSKKLNRFDHTFTASGVSLELQN